MNKSNTIQSEVLTLEKIFNEEFQFLIPSYQRPYVWSDDDVLGLFNDICKAFALGEPNYFIGTVLSSITSTSEGTKVYELIDGQQRTTTLMLMAIAFKSVGIVNKLSDLATYQGKPRINFSIREQVEQLLGSLAGLSEYQKPSDEKINENPYLKQINVGLSVLIEKVKSLKNDPEIDIEEVASYFYSKVQWVNNVVPSSMDLNQLFATMNTTGVQLEQADILKARLFKNIKSDKVFYDAIWVACEHMENYFERNVRKVFPNANWESLEPGDLKDLSNFKSHENQAVFSDSSRQGLSISELHSEIMTGSQFENTVQNEFETYELDTETVYCRPIIKFPLLLIHTYRIHLALNNQLDIGPRLKSDRLLEIFQPLADASEDDIKKFIELLWKVRYYFDASVIKWVETDDSTDSILGLTYQNTSVSKGKKYINRKLKEQGPMVLLQSVRNFTGERSAQYWLTPFLTKLIKENINEDSEALRYLEQIDNEMSLANVSQKEASFFISQGINFEKVAWSDKESYFHSSLGTSFEHYWFQKLEYLLWKKINSQKSMFNDEERRKFNRFRITSKNSIEHVHPQNEEYSSQLKPEVLNSFGNLVLLSPGENSSYSNQNVDKKMIDFKMKSHFDSLKLKEIFDLKGKLNWDQSLINKHLASMLNIFKEHYSKTNRES